MKRRALLQHTSALTLLGLLAACGGSGSSSEDTADTTLLVYLVASDLLDGRGAERDIDNMLRAINSPRVNVILQIGGGATAGEHPGIDMQQTRRYRLAQRPGTAIGWTLEELPAAQQPLQVAMNLPQTLQDFIQWAAREYPAQQYALSMWNHGGGPIHGFGNDKATGGGKAMSLSDITSALQRAGVQFELIGFDACLMASLEVASSLAPHSRYLVASEEVTTGWDWSQVVNFLAAYPKAKGDAMGRAILDSYKAFDKTEPLDFTAYSVSDLSKTAPLVKVLDQVAQTLKSAIDSQGLQAWWAIAVARREAQDFQTNLFQKKYDLVDVKSLVFELGKVEMLPVALVQQFNAAFDALVVHDDGSEDDASGLMMYFPSYSTLNTALLEQYRAVKFSPAYHSLIDTYTAFAVSDKMPYVAVGAPRIEAGVAVADVSLATRPLSAELRAMPVLTRPFDQGFGALVKNGLAWSVQSAAAQDQQVRLDNYSRWPMVQGQLVTMLAEDEEDDDLFQIPVVILNTETRELTRHTGMLMAMRESDGHIYIRWLVLSETPAGSNAAMLEIQPGMLFAPLCLDLDSNDWTPSPMTKTLEAPKGDWLVTLEQPSDAGYALHLMVSDLTGYLRSSATGLAMTV